MLTRIDWCLLIIGVCLSASGAIFLKLGALNINYSETLSQIAFQIVLNWKILLGILFYGVPVLIWIYLLKSIDVSYLQPLFSSIYIVTPLMAKWFLGEDLNPVKWGGIAIILLGIVVFARG